MKDLTEKSSNIRPSNYLILLRLIEKVLNRKILIKYSIIIISIIIIFFPNIFGYLLGKWYNELTTSFNNVLK